MVSSSSQSTADLLAVVSNRISWAFNRSGTISLVALDISKAFDRVQYAGLLYKPKPYGISGRVFGLGSPFRGNRRLGVVLEGKSLQKYPIRAGVPRGSILDLTLFVLDIDDLLDDVIYNITTYADDTIGVKMGGFLVEEKSLFKILRLFLLNWIGTFTLSLLLKLPLRKLNFFLLTLLCLSVAVNLLLLLSIWFIVEIQAA